MENPLFTCAGFELALAFSNIDTGPYVGRLATLLIGFSDFWEPPSRAFLELSRRPGPLLRHAPLPDQRGVRPRQAPAGGEPRPPDGRDWARGRGASAYVGRLACKGLTPFGCLFL